MAAVWVSWRGLLGAGWAAGGAGLGRGFLGASHATLQRLLIELLVGLFCGTALGFGESLTSPGCRGRSAGFSRSLRSDKARLMEENARTKTGTRRSHINDDRDRWIRGSEPFERSSSSESSRWISSCSSSSPCAGAHLIGWVGGAGWAVSREAWAMWSDGCGMRKLRLQRVVPLG